uniref:Uncharacterized protein n=1 Tax=Glossina pallidipes TaxID=7398 RepID=A0A1A9Z433_GLOPL
MIRLIGSGGGIGDSRDLNDNGLFCLPLLDGCCCCSEAVSASPLEVREFSLVESFLRFGVNYGSYSYKDAGLLAANGDDTLGQPPSCHDDNSTKAEVILGRIRLCLLGAIGLLPTNNHKGAPPISSTRHCNETELEVVPITAITGADGGTKEEQAGTEELGTSLITGVLGPCPTRVEATLYLVTIPLGRRGGSQLIMTEDSEFTTDLTRSGASGTASSVVQDTVGLTTPSPALAENHDYLRPQQRYPGHLVTRLKCKYHKK